MLSTHYKATDPANLDSSGDKILLEKIKKLLVERNAVLVAHYYTPDCIQELAQQTGGCIADSLEMARFGKAQSADRLIVSGVRFMGETAKILSPEKKVLMPSLEATCSLDISCPEKEFGQFCDDHPDHTVVVYANTSAAVKARADWVVTSSCAIEIVTHLKEEGHKIIWAPDRYLGNYIQQQTQADMLLWQGACIVHEEFKIQGIEQLKRVYPEAAVLVHPESPLDVINGADVVGSTSQLIAAAKNRDNKVFIVATEQGIFYKMRQLCPEKEFVLAPTAGNGADCKSCGHCPWMAMNELEALHRALLSDDNEVTVDTKVREKALIPLKRMLDFNAG